MLAKTFLKRLTKMFLQNDLKNVSKNSGQRHLACLSLYAFSLQLKTIATGILEVIYGAHSIKVL